MKNYAIILAGGDGKRLGSEIPKCFIKINDQELYKYCLKTFLLLRSISKVILVVPKGYLHKVDIQHKKLIVVSGGHDRNKSFEKGMKVVLKTAKPLDKVLIHDAARPNVLKQDIQALLKSELDYGTLAYIGEKNKSDYHIKSYNIQTPQFTRVWLYQTANIKDEKGKDLISYFNIVPSEENFIVSTNKEDNFKVTFIEDLDRVKNIKNN